MKHSGNYAQNCVSRKTCTGSERSMWQGVDHITRFNLPEPAQGGKHRLGLMMMCVRPEGFGAHIDSPINGSEKSMHWA